MTGKTRLAVYLATVGAVMVLAIDWDPDEPARRKAVRRHPAARRTTRIELSDREVFRRFADIAWIEAISSNEGEQ